MTCRTPLNCIFEVDDFESEWLYRQPFDYIHARELEGCIENPDQLFRQALEHLTPGGYLEMQAVDGFFESDDGTAEQAVHAQAWIKSMLDGARKFGKPLDTCSKWKEQMEDAGFVDVRQEVFKVSSYFGGFCEVWVLLVLLMLMIKRSSRSDLGPKTQNSRRLGLGSICKSYKS